MKHLTLLMAVAILALTSSAAVAQTRDGAATMPTTLDAAAFSHAAPGSWLITFSGRNRAYDLSMIQGDAVLSPAGRRPCPLRLGGTRVLARNGCTVRVAPRMFTSVYTFRLVGR
jgi:hypothetical protein